MCSNGQLAQGMTVSIELLRDLPTATGVNLTPLTADDWEILVSLVLQVRVRGWSVY